MKKTVKWCLGMLLISSLVISGCSKGNTSSTSSPAATDGASSPAATVEAKKADPVDLDIFMIGDTEVDWKSNKFTQEMNEKLNAKLNIQINNGETAKDKRQLALTSGDYADVFMVNWNDLISPAEQMKLGQQGVLLPLNDLINEYAPNIKKRMEEFPYYKASVTSPDGKIYGLPTINECYHCSFGGKMWVNTEWLKKLKMEMPTTTDEFKKMLKAFKDNDLNNNGKKDEVGLTGYAILPLMNAFIEDDAGGPCNNTPCYLSVNGGKVDINANKPAWKEGLAYIASLYAEGLIDPGAFTQKWEAMNQLTNREGIAMVGAVQALHPYAFIDSKNPINQQYAALPPLKGPSGFQSTPYGGNKVIMGASFAITNKASKEQQIAAIKLADYLATEEGTIRETFGEKGVNWVEGTASDLGLDGKQAKIKVNPLSADETRALNNSWGEIGPFVKSKEFRASIASAQDPKAPEGYELRLFKATQLYDGFQPKETLPGSLFLDPADAEEYGFLITNINKYVEENMLKFIAGNKKLATDWDTYVAGFNKLKLDRYLEITQKALDSSAK